MYTIYTYPQAVRVLLTANDYRCQSLMSFTFQYAVEFYIQGRSKKRQIINELSAALTQFYEFFLSMLTLIFLQFHSTRI